MVLTSLIPKVDERKIAILTALGKVKADLVVKNTSLVNVYSEEIIENVDIAIKGRLIARVGKCDDVIGPETLVIDGTKYYTTPGFIDAHIHIESSFLTPTKFVKAVLPHGTTTVFADPHEIGNVLGVEGVKEFIRECSELPIKILITVPSCIPACKFGLETSPNRFTVKDINELLSIDNTACLGELMDDLGILSTDEELLKEVEVTMLKGLKVCGHAPGLRANELSAYLVSGANSDHEVVTAEDALEKIRLGMYVMVRLGTFSNDLYRIIRHIPPSMYGMVMLVSDDLNVHDILTRGHLDYIASEAVKLGLDPVRVLKMITLIPAQYYGLDHIIGSVGPGKIADIVMLKDLRNMVVDKVICNGKLLVDHGKLIITLKEYEYPEKFVKTVKIPEITTEKFKVKTSLEKGEVKVRVIGIEEGTLITKHLIEKLPVEKNEVKLSDNIAKVAVIERHGISGNCSVGFVKNFPISEGAVAATISHDTHNLTVIGTNDNDMYLAVKTMSEIGGGLVLTSKGEVKAKVNLPVAGLMSFEEPEVVNDKILRFLSEWEKIGGKYSIKALAPMFLLSLVVIPELRITDKGLVDVHQGKIVNLIVSD